MHRHHIDGNWYITYCVISDLLLSLLLPFCSFAPIWPGEACEGLHTLLYVSCHTLLQWQGQHLTPDHHRKHTIRHNKSICNGQIHGPVQNKCHTALVKLNGRCCSCQARLQRKAITDDRAERRVMIRPVSVASERLVRHWEPKGLISVPSQHTQIIHKCLSDYRSAKGRGYKQAITDFELALCNSLL